MTRYFSVRKRIFTGLLSVGLLVIFAFSLAIKFSNDYLESVILNSNYQDELRAIIESKNQSEIWLPRSTHTYGFLSSRGNVPLAFIEYGEGQYHDVYWNQQRFHLFVSHFDHGIYKNDMLYIAIQINAIERYENQLNLILVFSAVTLSLILVWMAYTFTSLISHPVTQLSSQVSQLGANDSYLEYSLGDSDLIPIEEAINGFLKKIQEHLKREKMFSAIASHELRTPISTIRSSLETFIKNCDLEKDDPRQIERIFRAKRAVIEMQYITESLLYLAKQDNEASYEREAYQLGPLIKEIIAEHRALLRNDNIVIKLIDKMTSTFNIRHELVKILVGNLLRNALENTFEGEISIELQDHKIQVRDSGKGTPDEILNWINKRNFDDVQEKHIGIGLFLVARLCQQLDWQFKACNQYPENNLPDKKGSCFELCW